MTRSGGPELAGAGHELVCDGTLWRRVFSHSAQGFLAPQVVNPAGCDHGVTLTYDATTGGLVCGVLDSVPPVWVTASGTLAVTQGNQRVYLQVEATDEVSAVAYAKAAGPAWLEVTSDGFVTGKVPEAGGAIFTVRASDEAGNTADRTFTLAVQTGYGPAGCEDPGDTCADGTVYAGKTPDGGGDFFVTESNALSGLPFNNGGGDWLDTGLADCSPGARGLMRSTCWTGRFNTDRLALVDSESAAGFQPHQAARWCYCLGEEHADAPDAGVPGICAGSDAAAADGHGHDDWYLPAIAELDVMYTNLVSPGDADNPGWVSGYLTQMQATGAGPHNGPQAGSFSFASELWSSSEYGSSNAWRLRLFGQGILWAKNKNENAHIRCARR